MMAYARIPQGRSRQVILKGQIWNKVFSGESLHWLKRLFTRYLCFLGFLDPALAPLL